MAAATPIVVGVRVRPFNQREARFQSECVVGMDSKGGVRLFQIVNGKASSSQPPREFAYDHAFWTHGRIAEVPPSSPAKTPAAAPDMEFADQAFVYEKLAAPVLENVLLGYNACLFAYGQTGSGKTYSMMGTPSDRGVLPRLGDSLFAELKRMKVESETLAAVEASFCEIYNEKVRDLMAAEDSGAPPQSLPIRQDAKKGIFVEGLSKYAVTSAEDFYVFLEKGLSSRAIGSTQMNNSSSRSHAVVIVVVSQTGGKGEKCGKLCLVDLAGSERVAATGATGQTALEGQNINLSLTQLGICLKRLAEQAEAAQSGKKQAAALPIPYRDSSLTYLLKENLGGNSRTAMLANISPASVNYDETLATLRFASIARKVQSVATVNENPQTRLILQLRQELAELKEKYVRLEARRSVDGGVPTTAATVSAGAAAAARRAAAAAAAAAPQPPTAATAAAQASPIELSIPTAIESDAPGAVLPPKAPSADSLDLDIADVAATAADKVLEITATSRARQPAQQEGVGEQNPSDDLSADDLDEEIRSLESIRHQTKSFVFLPPPPPPSAAAAPSSTLMPSPSFRVTGLSLNLSKLQSFRRPSGAVAATVMPTATTATASDADVAMHDTDLDDLLLGGRSGDDSGQRRASEVREINDSFALGLQYARSFRGEVVGDDPAQQQSQQQKQQQQTNVFLDANKPQLIHLNPDSATHQGVPLVMVLEEGENSFEIAGAQIAFHWDALANQVFVYGTPGSIAINGEVIEDEGSFLRHRDRVVLLESLAFRFSFAAGIVAQEGGFNKNPTSVDHLVLLERYYRSSLLLERSRDAMSIAKALVAQTVSLRSRSPSAAPATDDDSAQGSRETGALHQSDSATISADRSPRRSLQISRLRASISVDDDDYDEIPNAGLTPRSTPRNADPTLAVIGDDIAMFNEQVYKLEVELADLYPPVVETLLQVDASDAQVTFADAMDELRQHQAEQEQELDWLRSQVHGAGAKLEREMTFAMYVTPEKRGRSLSHLFGVEGTAGGGTQFADDDEDIVSTEGTESRSATPTQQTGKVTPSGVESGQPQPAAVAAAAGHSSRHALPAIDAWYCTSQRNLVVLDAESLAFEQSTTDLLTTRMVSLELAYHRKVRQLQTFGKNGPTRAGDLAMWERLYTDPPFLSDGMLQCERSATCQVKDLTVLGSSWNARVISSSRCFVYVFKKADGRERAVAAVYLVGATLVDLNDTDVELCPSCPRHSRDKSSNSKDAALLVRFESVAEKVVWLEWWKELAIPLPMPHHMLKRRILELVNRAKDHAYVSPYMDVLADASHGQSKLGKTRRRSMTTNWKPDESSQNCEGCKKAFSLFVRRHHCRICGGIFCGNCTSRDARIGNALSCTSCREDSYGSPTTGSPTTAGQKILGPSQSAVHVSGGDAPEDVPFLACVNSDALPQLTRLVQDFAVWNESDEPEPGSATKAPVGPHATAATSRVVVFRMRIDHYQGRVHTYVADDLVSVSRCATVVNRLFLTVRVASQLGVVPLPGGSASSPPHHPAHLFGAASVLQPSLVTKIWAFRDAYQRELALESIVALLGQRLFLNTLSAARSITTHRKADVLVKDEQETLSLLRTTTDCFHEFHAWVGVEVAGRQIPFYRRHAFYFVLGRQESWSEKTLDMCGLEILCQYRLGPHMPTMYCIVDASHRKNIMGTPVTCTSVPLTAGVLDAAGGDDGSIPVAALISLQIRETRVAFVATNYFEVVTQHSSPMGPRASLAASGIGGSPSPPAAAAAGVTASSSFHHQDPNADGFAAQPTLLAFESSVVVVDAPPAPNALPLFHAPRGALPNVDVCAYHDHVFIVGAPPLGRVHPNANSSTASTAMDTSGNNNNDGAEIFHTKTSGDSSFVQVASAEGASVKKSGRTWCHMQFTTLNFHAHKFSASMEVRCMIALQAVRLRSRNHPLLDTSGTMCPPTSQGDGGDSSALETTTTATRDLLSDCELWANAAFDRCDPATGQVPPYSLPVQAAALHQSESGSQNNHMNCTTSTTTTAILIANSLPEYFKSRSVFLTVKDIGSCRIHVAALQEGVNELQVELLQGGVVVADADVVLQQRWIS